MKSNIELKDVIDLVKQCEKEGFLLDKTKSINDPNKKKEIKVTGEHVMVTFNDKKEHKLILAKELKGNELFDTDDGLYQIYEIGK